MEIPISAIFSVFSGSINNLADDRNARGIVEREVACDSATITGLEVVSLVAWDELPMYPRVARALAGLVPAYPGLWHVTPLAYGAPVGVPASAGWCW